ncbi:hypothetical protein PWT90_00808 [Aphanocladium album]|nr:hypothetical protein PWT90_00808 [Aphanocladium album]
MGGESFKQTVDDCIEWMNNVPMFRRRQCILPGVDGPWVEHPDELKIFENEVQEVAHHATDRTPRSYKEGRHAMKDNMTEFENAEKEFVGIDGMICIPPVVDLGTVQGTDSDIEEKTERYYVYHSMYMSPPDPKTLLRPIMLDRFRRDWKANACGIYYRHYYSPAWLVGKQTIWVPSLEGRSWELPTEETRRTRAKQMVKHAIMNHKGRKSEYSWEADAWTDVFSPMREDPLIALDKQRYFTMEQTADKFTCLLSDEENVAKRIPDLTVGLAVTENIKDECLHPAALERIMLHRHCGLVSDPSRKEPNLAFPFAVYEAKGYDGDPREARLQACTAGAAYLDLLDALALEPGKAGPTAAAYQEGYNHNAQVFALTSFGPHWHIMVGYKRMRRKEEHAGVPGMSKYVYMFHRIWSGRIVTERKAWELLSLVDLIHIWGRTQHRDYVMRHLKAWNKLSLRLFIYETAAFCTLMTEEDWQLWLKNVPLPTWARTLKAKKQHKVRERMNEYYEFFFDIYKKNPGRIQIPAAICSKGDCSTFPGYPQFSAKDAYLHGITCHGESPGEDSKTSLQGLFEFLQIRELGDWKQSASRESRKRKWSASDAGQ